MFDTLSSSLQRVFKKVRGHGRLSEENIRDSIREVRLALLEADVHFEVVKEFIARLKERCAGQQVLDSVTPGQQFVKLVQDEMERLLGGTSALVDMNGDPATVMMLGLHGSGKTTTSAKLAARWRSEGRNVILVAADIRRPAAVDQLQILGQQIEVDVLAPHPGERVPDLGARALAEARSSGRDVVIFDTGGRFQIDDELVQELQDLRRGINIRNVLLVVDAALGQESVSVAQGFQEKVGLTGLILTKLDGDARGGAALSICSITGCPVVYTGTGEKVEDLESFHPGRMASRILGMGDMVSLVEKAQNAFDEESTGTLQKKLRSKSIDLEDFLDQLRQLKKMGSIGSVLDMLPMPQGMRQAIPGGDAQIDQFAGKAEAIILSMTPKERHNPRLLNGNRRKRIARGSGTQPSDINELMRRFQQARKMTKRMMKMQKSLKGMM